MRISDWSSDVCSSDLEVERLDAVGALVDRQDAGVAVVLRGAGLLDEAHAAVHLHAERGDLAGGVGAPGLHNRNQQVEARLRRLAPAVVGQIGSAQCRERVCQSVSISVGAVSLTKTKHPQYTPPPHPLK